MKIKLYQIDAFTDKLFSGNPAAVCPLQQWLSDDLMQSIALENNLAETAFYVKKGDRYDIRWFTPAVEVDLCGHATLSAAHVLFHHEHFSGNEITFYSHRSGILKVSKKGSELTLDFPVDSVEEIPITGIMADTFSRTPIAAYKGKTDYMLVFSNEKEIADLRPDFGKLMQFPNCRGVIVTAKGDQADFVSRFFAPQSGINEDPVTGSAHTTLTPYWTQKLNKKVLAAVQLSTRRGWLICERKEERVLISGKAKTYLIGEINIT